MKLFRHLGLMIAVFWCAAMAMAPMAAAAGAGQSSTQGNPQASGLQSMNPGQANPGGNQMQQDTGQGTGSTGSINQQGNGQDFAGPGQGNGPQEFGMRNTTGFRNQTLFAPDGNRTAPPDTPDWDPDNSTAMNATAGHGPRGNTTSINMTDIPPPVTRDPANMTSASQTWHGQNTGNMSMHAPPQPGNGTNQSQQQSSDTLIAELITWLKAHMDR
jgi:hypothetical protein